MAYYNLELNDLKGIVSNCGKKDGIISDKLYTLVLLDIDWNLINSTEPAITDISTDLFGGITGATGFSAELIVNVTGLDFDSSDIDSWTAVYDWQKTIINTCELADDYDEVVENTLKTQVAFFPTKDDLTGIILYTGGYINYGTDPPEVNQDTAVNNLYLSFDEEILFPELEGPLPGTTNIIKSVIGLRIVNNCITEEDVGLLGPFNSEIGVGLALSDLNECA